MSFLLMSGYSPELVCETAPGYQFLQKPFNREGLRSKVSQMLQKASSEDTGSP
jgi:hypothetical protein